MKAERDASGARRAAWPAPLGGAMLSDARLGEAGPQLFDPARYGERARPVDAGGGRPPGSCTARAGRACCAATGAAA